MRAKFSILAVSALPIIPIALACGGDDNNNTIKIPDAAPMVDAPVICTASATYPAPAVPGRAWDYREGLFGSDSMGNPSPHEIDYVAALDTATPRDVLYIALFAGYGVFQNGIANGTYTIAGDDTKFSTCGACILVASDVTTQGTITDWYMGTSGTLTITRFDIGNTTGSDGSAHFVGTLSNMNFVHVAKSSQGGPGDAIQDNCVSALPAATLDAKLAVGSATIGNNGESARTLDNIPIRVLTNRRF